MIDIHHHLLWDLDDGSDSLATSVEMVRMAYMDGITHIVCTPHANPYWAFRPDDNARKIAELREAIHGRYDVMLGSGCDFHLSYDNIDDARANPAKYAINGGGYLLVELPEFAFPLNLVDIFYQLQIAGITPILTHPERNPTLQAHPKRMMEWLRGGVLVQITADSILGRFGKIAQKAAHQLLSDDWVQFVATDAHNISTRPPNMKQAREWVAKHCGEEMAVRLFETNPRAVFYGKPLGPQPESKRIFEAFEDRRNWWQKMLRR